MEVHNLSLAMYGPQSAGWTYLVGDYVFVLEAFLPIVATLERPVGPENLSGLAPGPIPGLLWASVSQVVQ